MCTVYRAIWQSSGRSDKKLDSNRGRVIIARLQGPEVFLPRSPPYQISLPGRKSRPSSSNSPYKASLEVTDTFPISALYSNAISGSRMYPLPSPVSRLPSPAARLFREVSGIDPHAHAHARVTRAQHGRGPSFYCCISQTHIYYRLFFNVTSWPR